MTELTIHQESQIQAVSTMSAMGFLKLYKDSGIAPAYVRGAKSFIEFCFQYSMPLNESSVGFYSVGKSPTSKSFAKRAVKFFEGIGVSGLVDDLSTPIPPRYHASIESFLKGSANIGSEETRKTYSSVLNKYFVHCNQNNRNIFCLFTAINYKDWMIKEGYSASYINIMLSALRSMARYILNNRDKIDGLDKDECDNLKEVLLLKKVRQKFNTYRKKELSQQERELFINSITDDMHKLQMSLMAYEGLRRGEVPRVRIQDFDFDQGTLNVRGKGYVSEPLPVKLFGLSAKLAKKLIGIKKKGKLFPELKKELVSSRAKFYLNSSGIMKEGLSAHSLRHTALQALTDNGAPIEIVQLQARHSEIKTTQVYTNRAVQRRFLSEINQYEQRNRNKANQAR